MQSVLAPDGGADPASSGRAITFAMRHLREVLGCPSIVRHVHVYSTDPRSLREVCVYHGYTDEGQVDVRTSVDWLVAHLFTGACVLVGTGGASGHEGSLGRGAVCAGVKLGIVSWKIPPTLLTPV